MVFLQRVAFLRLSIKFRVSCERDRWKAQRLTAVSYGNQQIRRMLKQTLSYTTESTENIDNSL